MTLHAFVICAYSTTGLAQSFHGIGDLPGGRQFSEALAISRDGRLAVGDSVTVGASFFAISESCQWTSGDGLGALDPAYAGIATTAFAASRDGSTVAGMLTIVPINVDVEAFRWTAETGLVSLGDLPGGLTNAVARGISADGSVVVGYGSSAASYASCLNCVEAFVWTAGDGMIALGDLPGGMYDSRAHAITADGSMIVGQGSTPLGPVAVRWEDGSIISMGYLPSSASTPKQSQCLGVSADGRWIVGGSSSENGIYEAFRWEAEEGMQPLGDLPGGPFQSYAYAVSDDGQVVVGMGLVDGGLFGSGEGRAFIWDQAHGIRSLQQVLSDSGVDLAGWKLSSARGISADGTVIAGYGVNPAGFGEGWVATLPRRGGGDMDCDGTVNQFDIDPFVLALRDRAAYHDSFPACDFLHGDTNGDGSLNQLDIDAFVALLTH